MQNRNLIIFLVSLFVAGIAVLLVNSYLSGVEKKAEVQAEQQKLSRIAVATQPLQFGDKLTPENVRLQNFPAASVPQGAFHSMEDVLKDGRVALRPLVPGEPILADKVSGTDGRAVLSANLPNGMRAVSVPVSAITGVSGFVRPGDTVDVLLTRQIPGEGARGDDLMTDVILERVQVLAIDQVASEQATEPKVGQTAVLQVNLADAQRLAIASKIGTLSLALRNVETDEEGAVRTVTARDLGQGGYIRRRAIPVRREPQYAQASMPVATAPAGQLAPQPSGPSMT
ncbi:MAG: Flp pilus assembly protein CpaB, partial [Betaproteobacteria bacterium]|nr:Flp pilus assembly protein CpaB [Betaproteobacteria bacterium]